MINRRAFIASGGAAALASPTSARVAAGENIDYAYEVTRTEAEWLERLTDEEFVIMREGFTEARKSSHAGSRV